MLEVKLIRRRRETRSNAGPWKWQIVEILEQVREGVRELNAKMEKMISGTETQRKLSEAGKKSAAARKAKFGSAHPDAGKKFHTIIMDDPTPAKAQIEFFSSRVHETDVFSEPVPEPVRKKKGRKAKPPTDGSLVWDRYEECYRKRWNTDPLRNAQANKNCCQLVALVGKERAVTLVAYYIGRTDAFFTNAKHPLGLCLVSAQKLVTEMETGTVMVMRDAQRLESQSQTERAIQQYLKQQNAEQVHVKEVENADSGTT